MYHLPKRFYESSNDYTALQSNCILRICKVLLVNSILKYKKAFWISFFMQFLSNVKVSKYNPSQNFVNNTFSKNIVQKDYRLQRKTF